MQHRCGVNVLHAAEDLVQEVLYMLVTQSLPQQTHPGSGSGAHRGDTSALRGKLQLEVRHHGLTCTCLMRTSLRHRVGRNAVTLTSPPPHVNQ